MSFENLNFKNYPTEDTMLKSSLFGSTLGRDPYLRSKLDEILMEDERRNVFKERLLNQSSYEHPLAKNNDVERLECWLQQKEEEILSLSDYILDLKDNVSSEKRLNHTLKEQIVDKDT